MRIAVYAHRVATRAPTGIDRYLRELTIALAERDDVELRAVAPAERDEPAWLPDNVELHRVRGPRKALHASWSLVHRPRIDRAVGDVDLVHVTAPTFPVPASASLVYTVHDLMPLLHPEWFGRVHRWGFRAALDDARDRAAAVIVDSTATAAAVTEVAGIEAERVIVVPLGVAPRFLDPVDAADVARVAGRLRVEPKSYVVYVGQLNERKNVAVLVEALARMGDDRPALVLAGPPGRGAARIRDLVDRRGLGADVRFAGYVKDEDLPPLLAGARALLHPSRFEGFGLTPLEAMAVGVPAIVADTAVLPDAAGDAAIVAPGDDPTAWAAAISRLGDDDFVGARRSLGRERAHQCTWSRTAAETVAVYERVLAHRTSRG